MPVYDVAAISRRQTSNKKMNKLTSRLAKDLKKRGGVIRKVNHYGHRPLAYPIRRKGQKHDVGRYTRYFVQTSPQGLKEFLTTLRLDEDIIRYKPFKVTPTEMLDMYNRPPFTHTPKISEAHFDALKRTTNINYYIARTLLIQGKMTEEEIKACGTTPVQFEPYFKSREQDLAERVFAIRNAEDEHDYLNQFDDDSTDDVIDRHEHAGWKAQDSGSDMESYTDSEGNHVTRRDIFRQIDDFSDFTELSSAGEISSGSETGGADKRSSSKQHKSYEVLKSPDFNYIDFSSSEGGDVEQQKASV